MDFSILGNEQILRWWCIYASNLTRGNAAKAATAAAAVYGEKSSLDAANRRRDDLEWALKVKLVVSDNSGSRLTVAGEQLLEHARRILHEYDALSLAVRTCPEIGL